jgi:hypothetical protein
MAAAIITKVRGPEVPGSRRWAIFDLTPNTSYPTNGEPMTASLFGMQQVDCVIPMGSPLASAATVNVYDRAHNTVRIYVASTGAEATGDQSGNLVTLLVIGE